MAKNNALRPGWREIKFGEVVRLSRARCQNPLAEGFERFVGLEHLEPGDLRIRSWGNVADGTTFTNVFKPGQVLFGKRRAYQRKVAVADFAGLCSGDIYVLESKDTQVLLAGLLPFLCQTDTFFEHAVGTSAGSLSPRTNWSSLAEFDFPLPPKGEQKRLVEAFLAAEAMREESRNLVASSRQMLLAQLSSLLKQALYEGQQLDIPSGWDVVAIGDVLHRITYGFTNPMPTTADGPWMITAKDVLDGRINFLSARKTSQEAYDQLLTDKSRPSVDDVLITKDGTLGRVAVVGCDDVCINQSVAVLKPNNRISSRFLAWTLRAPQMQRRLLQDAGGSAIKHLYITKIDKTKFPLPPRQKQDELVSLFDSTEAGIRTAEKRFGQASDVLRSMLGTLEIFG